MQGAIAAFRGNANDHVHLRLRAQDRYSYFAFPCRARFNRLNTKHQPASSTKASARVSNRASEAHMSSLVQQCHVNLRWVIPQDAKVPTMLKEEHNTQ